MGMRALIVYESMFGNTRAIAEAVGEGLGSSIETRLIPVGDAEGAVAAGALDGLDLLVVGGPTHVRSMSRASTRKGASAQASKPDSGLVLETGADTGPGAREWLDSLADLHLQGAAFDTRIKAPAIFTGRASKAIKRSLSRHGVALVVPPQSFLVDKKSHLLPGETARARAWGVQLAKAIERTASYQS
jgi:menaquinone-dependent protoporphyrinogen IX oxidase